MMVDEKVDYYEYLDEEYGDPEEYDYDECYADF